jgi:prophage regulatory protein
VPNELLNDGLPPDGFVRLSQIIRPSGPLPISRSTFWAWVAAGRLQPIKLGPRLTVFHVDDVRTLLREQTLPAENNRSQSP